MKASFIHCLSKMSVTEIIFIIISLRFEEKTIILISETFTYSKTITHTNKGDPITIPSYRELGMNIYFGCQLSLGSPPNCNSRAMLLSCLIIPEECCQGEQARSLPLDCFMLSLPQIVSPFLPYSQQ